MNKESRAHICSLGLFQYIYKVNTKENYNKALVQRTKVEKKKLLTEKGIQYTLLWKQLGESSN